MKTGIFAVIVITALTLGMAISGFAAGKADDQAINMPSSFEQGSSRFALGGSAAARPYPYGGDQAVNMPSAVYAAANYAQANSSQLMAGLKPAPETEIESEWQRTPAPAPTSVYPGGLRYFPGSTTN
jgi:hypothetical protein